jgi:tetratricopeptide (TPR) repeat protein
MIAFSRILTLRSTIAIAVAFLSLFVATDTLAVGAVTSSSSSKGDLKKAEKAIGEEDFEKAIGILRTVLESDPDNADAYNFLAYSQRNIDQIDEAMENYIRALDLDPDHKGALEYQGELYLKLGDKLAAEANLVRLGELCPRGCEEHATLQAAIERFKDGNVSWTPAHRSKTTGE